MTFLLSGATNQTSQRVNGIITLYFRASGFDSLQVTFSNIFFIFFLSTRQRPKQYINTGYDRLVPHLLQFFTTFTLVLKAL
jgi:hypothetical protein